MPSLSAKEIAQRRAAVVYALLQGIPRSDIPHLPQVNTTARTVARDIRAVAKAIDHSGSNREALEETIGAMRDAGRLEKVDNAKLAVLRAMATQLDTDTTNSQMFRVYWEALEALTDDADDDGGVDGLLEQLFSDTRDTPTS